MRLTKNTLILLAILLLSAFLRVYHLGNESLWLDEAISVRAADVTSTAFYKHKLLEPSLYNTLLHSWIRIFGNSESCVRFLSVLFGLAAVFMIYKLSAMIFNKQTGILSSLLLGLSVFHIQYSQEARNLSLLSLLTLCSMYFFIKLIKKRTPAAFSGYIISSILLLYSHFMSPFIILAQNLYFLTLFASSKSDCKTSIRQWIGLQLVLIIVMIPCAILLLGRIVAIKHFSLWWIPPPAFLSIPVSFFEYSGSIYLTAIFFILLCFSIIGYKKISGIFKWKSFLKAIESYRWELRFIDANNNYFLLIWLFIPIILMFMLSKLFVPIYWTRHTIGSSLAFYILAANGIRNLRPRLVKFIIAVIILLSLVNLRGYYGNSHKERWREAAEHLDKNSKPGDLVIFCPGACEIPFDYYSKKDGLINKGFFAIYDIVNEDNIRKLAEAVKDYKRAWVIVSHCNDPTGLLRKTLSESHNPVYYKSYISKKYLNIEFNYRITNDYIGIEEYLFEKK